MDQACPIEYTVALINGKWKLLILKELSQGPVRYGQLGERLPAISSKVLTQQLREMEADGLIARTVFPEIPPRVEYSLSEMGTGIFTIFVELRRWGLEKGRKPRVRCSLCGQCQPFIQDKPKPARRPRKQPGPGIR